MTNGQDRSTFNLTAADMAAMDALVAAEFDVRRVGEAHADRAAQALSLLRVLDCAVPCEVTLVDVTMARVMRAGAPAGSRDDAPEAELSGDDIEALDAYVAADFRVARVAASLRERAAAIDAMVTVVTGPIGSLDKDLVDKTMRLIATTPKGVRGEVEMSSSARSSGFRLADLLSIAAVLLIGVAVFWPMLSTVRTFQVRQGCASNMASIASAVGSYAGDYRGSLPMATASLGGLPWWDVGTTPEHSNSANLYTLARLGYSPLSRLACGGNPCAAVQPTSKDAQDWARLEEVSYSYQIMFGTQRPVWDRAAQGVVLSDRSPVILRAARKERELSPMENSPNHGGQGQWVLRADGAAAWLHRPVIGHDNIWLPKAYEDQIAQFLSVLPEIRSRIQAGQLQGTISVDVEVDSGVAVLGTETPSTATDAFVGP